MISREYAEQWFPEFVKKVDVEIQLAQERVDEILGKSRKCDRCGNRGSLWKTDGKRLCVTCRTKPPPMPVATWKSKGKCFSCGCPRDEMTPGCRICYNRHWQRKKNARVHAKNL